MRFSPLKKPRSAVLVGIAIFLLFAVGSYLLGWSSLFTVSQVEIKGAPTPSSQQEISKKLNLPIGQKLARVDSRALSLRLKSAGWIESADISRNWISGKVEVNLHPRIAVAIYNEPGLSLIHI